MFDIFSPGRVIFFMDDPLSMNSTDASPLSESEGGVPAASLLTMDAA